MNKNELVVLMVVIAVVVVMALGLSGKDDKQFHAETRQPHAEKTLGVNAPDPNQIIGFNGQSTKIDVTKESLSAPAREMSVQGLRNVRIDESASSGRNSQGQVSGLSGLKIE